MVTSMLRSGLKRQTSRSGAPACEPAWYVVSSTVMPAVLASRKQRRCGLAASLEKSWPQSG